MQILYALLSTFEKLNIEYLYLFNIIISTFCKLSNNISCTLNDGLNGPRVR